MSELNEAIILAAETDFFSAAAITGINVSDRLALSCVDTAFYLKLKTPFSWKWAYYELLRVGINGMDSGSAIPSTSREDFYSLPVCLPPLVMFQGFVALFTPVFEMRVAIDAESAKIAALRDYLLPRLLSGQVRVGECRASDR